MLFEVMVATAIMGILFSAIFALQSTVTRSVMWVTYRFDRTLYAHNFLVESSLQSEAAQKDEITLDKKIAYPKTDLQYKKSKVTSEELFGKYVRNIVKEQVTMQWKDGLQQRQDAYVTYAYKPKKVSQEKTKTQEKATGATTS